MIPQLCAGKNDRLVLTGSPVLEQMYTLSPYVWKEEASYRILVRAVNRDEDAGKKVARVYSGTSADGITFCMLDRPVIAPGPEAFDRDGCEDPTVVFESGTYTVFYSGWNQERKTGQMLTAAGPQVDRLEKRGPVPGIGCNDYPNAKEATIVRGADGTWTLFFEFAQDGKSKIGAARSSSLGGPWIPQQSPLQAREGKWDSWHLSPGPIVEVKDNLLFFYNGANREAHWRVGWALLSRDCRSAVDRCDDVLIAPPDLLEAGQTDIAFAASAVTCDGGVNLYYSIADLDMRRVRVCSTG